MGDAAGQSKFSETKFDAFYQSLQKDADGRVAWGSLENDSVVEKRKYLFSGKRKTITDEQKAEAEKSISSRPSEYGALTKTIDLCDDHEAEKTLFHLES